MYNPFKVDKPISSKDWIPFHKRYSLEALSATTRRHGIISDQDRGFYLLNGIQPCNGIAIENTSAEQIQVELNGQTDRALVCPSNAFRVFEGQSFSYDQIAIYNRSATATSNNEVIITCYKLREGEI
jgi:hypothetical protein